MLFTCGPRTCAAQRSAARKTIKRNDKTLAVDLHCHVLAGIDDGPATIEESVALAQDAAAAGARVLVATPHVNQRYRNDATTIARLVDEAVHRYDRATTEEILDNLKNLGLALHNFENTHGQFPPPDCGPSQ